jgi:hypothetical protein
VDSRNGQIVTEKCRNSTFVTIIRRGCRFWAFRALENVIWRNFSVFSVLLLYRFALFELVFPVRSFWLIQGVHSKMLTTSLKVCAVVVGSALVASAAYASSLVLPPPPPRIQAVIASPVLPPPPPRFSSPVLPPPPPRLQASIASPVLPPPPPRMSSPVLPPPPPRVNNQATA